MLIDQNEFIDSAKNVQVYVKETEFKDVSIKKIRDVMRDDCQMSYRSIKRISIHGNSPKNLVLR